MQYVYDSFPLAVRQSIRSQLDDGVGIQWLGLAVGFESVSANSRDRPLESAGAHCGSCRSRPVGIRCANKLTGECLPRSTSVDVGAGE
jgi:hypothetical protein